MASTPRAGSFRDLVSDRPLRRAFVAGLAGRFGYALLPLCLLFSIADSSDSFALAATATAAFGLSGLATPVQARLLDRMGQARALPLVGVWFTAFLITAACSAANGVHSGAFWIALCVAGGLGAPSLGPAMRAQWREATDAGQRGAAYALDAIAEEVIFLIGPLGAAALLFADLAWWGVAGAALLMPIGVAGLASSPHAPGPQAVANGDRDWSGPLRRPGFRRLALMMALAGTAASAWLTVLAGLAEARGHASVVGVVEAATGGAAIIGALLWGRHAGRVPWTREVAILAGSWVPLAVLCLLFPTLWVVAVALSLTGFAMAPLYVVAYAASDHEADARHHTEASTWINTVTNVGTSLGAVSAASLYTHVSTIAVFAGILAALLLLLAVAAVTHERPPDADYQD